MIILICLIFILFLIKHLWYGLLIYRFDILNYTSLLLLETEFLLLLLLPLLMDVNDRLWSTAFHVLAFICFRLALWILRQLRCFIDFRESGVFLLLGIIEHAWGVMLLQLFHRNILFHGLELWILHISFSYRVQLSPLKLLSPSQVIIVIIQVHHMWVHQLLNALKLASYVWNISCFGLTAVIIQFIVLAIFTVAARIYVENSFLDNWFTFWPDLDFLETGPFRSWGHHRRCFIIKDLYFASNYCRASG